MLKTRKHINDRVFTAQGRNGLNSIASYKFRKFYKDKYLSTSSAINGKAVIDLWYEKPFFGKVDKTGDTIFLSETNLKALNTDSDKTIFVVDFVADAFSDLQNHFSQASFVRAIQSSNSLLNTLEPQTGWISVNNIYHSYITGLYSAFVKKYLNHRYMERRIRNFNDFVHVFILFVRDVGFDFPFTRSGYILSNRCPNTVCGLMIDLQGKGHSEDLPKVNNFIKDQNFRFFKRSAKNFGFMIDRNAPWRLVADLSSPKMQEYMSRYGSWSDSDQMINDYFYKSHSLDIDTMKAYLVEFYNSYVNGRPYTNCPTQVLEYSDVGAEGAKASSLTKRIHRQKITKEQVDMFYGPMFWLKTYLIIRMHESGVNWSEYRFKNKIKQILTLYKTFDFDTAMMYINSWAKKEMSINVAKMIARSPNAKILASDLQKLQEGYLEKEPTSKDVVSGHYKPDKEPPSIASLFPSVYESDLA